MSRIAEKLRPTVPKVLTALGMTMLAFMLSTVLMAPFSFSASAFLSNPEKSDFAITDFYSIVADSRPVRSIDDEIVIVNLNGLDRDGIAGVLELMPLLDPAAVGLDVAFVEPRDNDTLLLDAIAACPRLVMPVSLVHNPSGNDFSLGEISFFATSAAAGVPLGATNLPARYAKSTIREFQTFFPLSSPVASYSDSIPSFAVAVAATARPEQAERLFRRGRSLEMINYPS
ncbi:MAG: CHASE2 domain-containing protein, partial [Muribaculaceae bacterium]|nr:CHASE2 domain-containing protein [Muribaculaceae bacterium]